MMVTAPHAGAARLITGECDGRWRGKTGRYLR